MYQKHLSFLSQKVMTFKKSTILTLVSGFGLLVNTNILCKIEKTHNCILKVMKDWSDLEERYQDMRAEDPTSAEDFKKQMTERFQKTVQVL